ncbi:hypothetical protein NHQ30_005406 [Ciborinia camelliae]|nr:hypothetical protein NHQ30_005406 [Ciborinia camelliae]
MWGSGNPNRDAGQTGSHQTSATSSSTTSNGGRIPNPTRWQADLERGDAEGNDGDGGNGAGRDQGSTSKNADAGVVDGRTSRQRGSRKRGSTFNSHEQFRKSTHLATEPSEVVDHFPVARYWTFPIFGRAGQPPTPLIYRCVKPDEEKTTKVWLEPQYDPKSMPRGWIRLAPNIQKCVYRAIAWKDCWYQSILECPTDKHLGFCVLGLKTACANYSPHQKGPYACCKGPEYEVMRYRDRCFGDGCHPGLSKKGGRHRWMRTRNQSRRQPSESLPPPNRRHPIGYDLWFYHWDDDQELKKRREDRDRAYGARLRKEDTSRRKEREKICENLSPLYGKNTGDYDCEELSQLDEQKTGHHDCEECEELSQLDEQKTGDHD